MVRVIYDAYYACSEEAMTKNSRYEMNDPNSHCHFHEWQEFFLLLGRQQ